LKKLILFFLLSYNSLFAVEIKCDFEEVYQNGDVQQGFFLLKDQMLRYQYFHENLYTIIAKNDNYFLVNNYDNKIVQKITENTEAIKSLIKISSKFPNIKNQYEQNEMKIKIEKNSNNFIKRIAIISNQINLSINILNCNFQKINKKYFKPFNFEKYEE